LGSTYFSDNGAGGVVFPSETGSFHVTHWLEGDGTAANPGLVEGTFTATGTGTGGAGSITNGIVTKN